MALSAAHLEVIRAAIAEGLLVRKGLILTDDIIRDRAANLTEYLRPLIEDIVTEALRDAARGEAVVGEFETKGSER